MEFRLLVEGRDDFNLVTHLLQEHGITLDLNKEMLNCGGIDTLLNESLPAHLKGSYDALGIVIDADLDIRARWEAIRNRLRNHGYNPPDMPPPDGVIIDNRSRRVGVWLMPDNSLPGMLEDFVKELIDPADKLWSLAIDAVAEIPETERRFTPSAVRKAEVHTFLAWQADPGTPLGLAVTKKYFRTDGALARRFVAWFRALRSPAA